MTASPNLAFRPQQVDQLDGSKYAGLNCNCAAAAMAIERATIGAKRATGARIRYYTGDTSGGTNLDQIDKVANDHYNVNLDVERGLAFDEFMRRIKAGQGAVLQGACSATKGTSYQESDTFTGNHSWYVNDHNGDGFLVYLPLGDARRKGITDSPRRIPKSIVYKFAGALDIGGRKLGEGKVYAAFTRDTEPHVHLKYGAKRTSPFPDRTRASGGGNIRSAPRLASSYEKRDLVEGELLIMAQVTTSGDSYKGSRKWYGNHAGNEWVHESRLSHEGGTS